MNSDLISRQEAIEALDRHCDAICKYSKKQRFVMCGACPLGSALDVLDDLPPAQQWVPVSEMLPEENGSYLTTTRNGGVRVNHFYKYYGIFGYQNNAIAWMPMPEPYKGE